MECNEIRNLLPAQIDDELELRKSLELESHLRGCADCRAQLDREKALRTAVARHASYFRAPETLEARIKAELPSSTAHASAPVRQGWRWPSLAASVISMIAVAWSLGMYLSLPSANERLMDEIVASHVRSLLANRTVDVASSDQHTVKPWFNGKLDFSPPVRDLASEGFPLVGGRLDYIDHHPVAALVYRHAQHTINVFIAPVTGTADAAAPRSGSSRGFHTMHWTQDGMTYWAVSDVDADQLAKLSGFLREAERR